MFQAADIDETPESHQTTCLDTMTALKSALWVFETGATSFAVQSVALAVLELVLKDLNVEANYEVDKGFQDMVRSSLQAATTSRTPYSSVCA